VLLVLLVVADFAELECFEQWQSDFGLAASK
jgi:hypothetical protein